MKHRIRFMASWIGLAALAIRAFPASDNEPRLIPFPTSLTMGQGSIAMTPASRIVVMEEPLIPLAKVFALELKGVAGLNMKVCEGWARATPSTFSAAGDIVLALDDKPKAGGYLLSVTDRVEVRGRDYRGTAAGTATILQALELGERRPVTIPRMTIRDEPHADYCGGMLNLAGRDCPIEQIRDCLPLCRFYKIRYLHLHLTDDEGWTFPSTRYPQLGTKNAGTPGSGPPARRYELGDLTNLVRYADTLGVTLVPEIQMPAHSRAITQMLPEFGPDIGMMDITREAIYPVLTNILTEVAGVFASSPYIHIGGDEVDFTRWAAMPEASNYVTRTGCNPPEILGRFFTRMNATVEALGKRTIVWEGFEKNGACAVPTNIIVMSLHNQAYRADELVRDGYSIINCPSDIGVSGKDWNLYTCGGIALPTNAAVVGASWNIWTSPSSLRPVDLMRHSGRLSEPTWNTSTNRTSADLARRLTHTDQVADRLLFRFGWRLIGPFVSGPDSFRGPTRLELAPYAGDEVVRYTLDGTEPTMRSPACRDFIDLTATTVVKARVFDTDGNAVGQTWSHSFTLRKP